MDTKSIEWFSIFTASIPVVVIIVSVILGYLFNKKLERDREINSRKRKIYEEFLTAVTLSLFEGALPLLIDITQEYSMKDVHAAKISVISGYEKIKLWGTKGVVEACYDLFQQQIDFAKKDGEITQEQMKEPYYRLIFEMRKDLKMKNFDINKENIQIIAMQRNDGLFFNVE